MSVKLAEWKEARQLTRRVRELVEHSGSLTGIQETIEREFGVKYSAGEIRGIASGHGVDEGK